MRLIDTEQGGFKSETRKSSLLFFNIGHFLDHLFVLIFATAVLKLALDWNMSYAELLPYATLGMVAFGLGAIPAGLLTNGAATA